MTKTEKQLLDWLAAAAYAAYYNCISSHTTPAQQHYFDRMSKPQPGDLVLEISNWGAPIENRIGRLISAELEDPPVVPRETYDEEEWGRPYPPYQEKVWRLKTLDHRDFHWTNANFIVIPETPFNHPGRIQR